MDVGGGTQDILVYDERLEIENCPRLILPAPTQLVARRIERATAAKRDIFLTGNLMGGGACCRAVAEHVRAGLRVYAERQPALTIHDNLNRVRERGVRVVGRRPRGAEPIEMRDVDRAALQRAVAPFDITLPARCAVAVLDHGHSPTAGNRLFRFEQWRAFLQHGGHIRDLAHHKIPTHLTRMRAVRRDAPRALLMDTGAAAVWGALCDPVAARHRRKGLVMVNVGNQHTLAVLLRGSVVWGLFEHHTVRMTAAKLGSLIDRLREGSLINDDVLDDWGHGCATRPRRKGRGFDFVTVLGPKRAIADGLGYHSAAPHGDMMLTGAFGLVAAYRATTGRSPRL